MCLAQPVPEEAVRTNRQVSELASKFTETWHRKKTDEAHDLLREMARLDPDHPRLLGLLKFLYRGPADVGEVDAFVDTLGMSEAGRAYLMGFRAWSRRDNEAAESDLRAALEHYRSRGHTTGEAASLSMLGLVARSRAVRAGSQQGLDEAERLLLASIELYERVRDPVKSADVSLLMVEIEMQRQRPDKALEIGERALALYADAGDVEGQAIAWTQLGRTRARTNDPRGAIRAFESAAERRRQLGDGNALLTLLIEIAKTRASLPDVGGAIDTFEQALRLAEELEDDGRRALSQLEFGGLLIETGRAASAVPILEDAARYYGRAKDRWRECRALRRLGLARLRLHEYESATADFDRALQIARDVGAGSLEATLLNDRATVLMARRQLAAALSVLDDALAKNVELDRREGEQLAEMNLGVTYYQIGDFEAADRHLRKAVALARDVQPSLGLPLALENLGLVLSESQKVTEGLRSIEEAIEIWDTRDQPRDSAFARLNAAGLAAQLGRAEDAAQLLGRAKRVFDELPDPVGQAAALNLEASWAGDRGELDDALRLYDDSLAVADAFGLLRPRWIALAGRADGFRQQGRLDEAAREYRAAISLVEDLRSRMETPEFKMRFLARRTDLYERAIDTSARVDGPAGIAEAFRLAETARARSLIDLLAESHVDLRQRLSPELATTERAHLDGVTSAAARLANGKNDEERAGARRALAEAEERLDRFRAELRRAAPRYADVVYPEPVTLDRVRNELLDPDQTLLAYFVGNEHALLWVVEQDRVELLRLPPPDELRADVKLFLDLVATPGVRASARGAARAAAEGLGRELLPVGGLVPGRRLLVAADGPLHRLPFEALRRNGRYLVEDHEIVVIPSATALAIAGAGGDAEAGTFLGLGNPIAGEPAEPLLPHAGVELERIAELYPPSGRRLLVDDDFRKSRLRGEPLDRFRHIHFATHGWIDPDDPRYFGLRLSAPTEDDPDAFLHMDEVFTWRLEAELVVLSACRSGLGEAVRGEGLVGMTRAFLHAGARRVAVTLWDVDDLATSDFMQRFYRGMRSGEPVATALRKAKLEFIASETPARRQPYYWAPFVLVSRE